MGKTALVSDPLDQSERSARGAAVQQRVVDVRGLEKRYKKTIAVRGVDFSVDRGEIFGLIGPDGSGKSSLIRAIAGVQRYNAGSIEVFGQLIDSERSAEKVKSRIGLMPQGLGNNLYAQLSVEENIDYFAGLRLVEPTVLQRRKERLLKMTRLIDFRDRPMKQLSGGMKQKLGLVCTLIHQPAFVLLDEPTTGVDPVSRRDFWAILTELVHESGMTAIVSTAYMDEAAYMDRLALMMDGRVVSQGTEEDIESLVSGTVVSFETRHALAIVDQLCTTFLHVQAMGNVVRVFVPDKRDDEALAAVARLVKVERSNISTFAADMEDVLACLLSRETTDTDVQMTSLGSERDPPSALPRSSRSRMSMLFDIPRNLAERLRVRRKRTQLQSPSPSKDFAVTELAKTTKSRRFLGREGADKGYLKNASIPPHGSDRTPPICAHNLVRDFGKFRAVDDVSFDIEEGRIFGLLGANGAGKTTVIKMLTGLLPPTSGSGSVAGADMNHAGQTIKERIGYMSQSFSLYTDMTAVENLEFYAGVYGLFPRERQRRITEVVNMIGLAGYERRLTSALPMGIRQRLALGCALVHRPKVIFLDEPTSGVDVLGRRRFWEILVRLAREDGVAILVTTHYMAEAEHCDDLALMYAGRMVASGAPSTMRMELEKQVGQPIGLVTTAPLRSLQVARANGFDRAALFGRSLRILTKNADADEQRLRELLSAHDVQVTDAQAESATMEDVFVHSVLAQEKTTAFYAQANSRSQP